MLVTGGAGYIGSTLVPHLLREGHSVTVLDRFFFGQEYLESLSKQGALSLVRDDIRWFDGRILKDFDSVVDMAALSNDPAGELDRWKTMDINYLGRSRVARIARDAGVSRYILVSSCSIYGFQDGILTEKSPTKPLTTYANANLLAEQDNLRLASKDFTSIAVRLATAYGLSQRMRFDIAINGMTLGAVKNKRIPVMKDGTQWRPFVHVEDVSRAISLILTADRDSVNGELFNIGSDSQNYQIGPLAELVADSVAQRPQIEWYGTPDIRSYRVSFQKAKKILRFEPGYTPVDAAKEIEKALISGEVSDSIKTRTVEWYKHLLSDSTAGAGVALRGAVL
ncbi:MAG: SDR family oxidoreductase [Nitrososphaerales archaeon]